MYIIKNKYIKLFFYGAFSSLSFAPFYLFITFFFTLYYLIKEVEKSTSLKESFKVGWFFGFGYFIGNCYWYCNSLLTEPLKYAWLIPFAISIIPAFLACYTALTTLIFKYITIKFTIINKNTFYKSIIFSIIWSLFEYLRGVLLTGFPWNLICYSLSFSNILIQCVSIFGCYVFNFFVINIYTSFYVLKNKKYKYYSFYYIFLLLFIIIYGFCKIKYSTKSYYQYTVRLIQPNISIKLKNTINEKELLDLLLDKSLKNSDNIDYIIWPEGIFPYYIFNKNNDILDYLKYKLNNKTLITGGIRIDEYNKKIYNSVFIIKNGNIINYYDKYNLVPFGEFIPFRKIFPFINSIATNLDLNKSTNRRKLINIDNNFPIFSPNICYESIFPNSINKNAELIINFTNDVWFGNSSGPYQHFVALKFRAIENNIPALRIANSGISAVIDKNGKVIKKTKLNKEYILDITIPIK